MLFGLNAILGTIWWVFSWMININDGPDEYKASVNWMWHNLDNSTRGW